MGSPRRGRVRSRRLYVTLGRAAGQHDADAFAIIWNAAD
jgi:hypothetical protein